MRFGVCRNPCASSPHRENTRGPAPRTRGCPSHRPCLGPAPAAGSSALGALRPHGHPCEADSPPRLQPGLRQRGLRRARGPPALTATARPPRVPPQNAPPSTRRPSLAERGGSVRPAPSRPCLGGRALSEAGVGRTCAWARTVPRAPQEGRAGVACAVACRPRSGTTFLCPREGLTPHPTARPVTAPGAPVSGGGLRAPAVRAADQRLRPARCLTQPLGRAGVGG